MSIQLKSPSHNFDKLHYTDVRILLHMIKNTNFKIYKTSTKLPLYLQASSFASDPQQEFEFSESTFLCEQLCLLECPKFPSSVTLASFCHLKPP